MDVSASIDDIINDGTEAAGATEYEVQEEE
jgi:hypothetical protein